MTKVSSNLVAEFNLARSYMTGDEALQAHTRFTELDKTLTAGDQKLEGLLRPGGPRYPEHRLMWARVRYNLVANKINDLQDNDRRIEPPERAALCTCCRYLSLGVPFWIG